jgi:hypothetical protein
LPPRRKRVRYSPNLGRIAEVSERDDDRFYARRRGAVGPEEWEDARLCCHAAHLSYGGDVGVGRFDGRN